MSLLLNVGASSRKFNLQQAAHLADVNPLVLQTLKRSGALDVLGAENVFAATTRVLAAENMAWEAAQQWLRRSNGCGAAVAEGARGVMKRPGEGASQG